MIIKLVNPSIIISEFAIIDIISNLDSLIKSYKIEFVCGVKQEEYIICHLFSYDKLNQATFVKLAKQFSNMIKDTHPHYISIGKSFSSAQNVYKSYNSAIILMHSSFFYTVNTVLYNESESITSTVTIPSELVTDFSEALVQRREDKVKNILEKLYKILVNNKSILVNHAKDVYYKLFLELNESANNYHISISADSNESILDYVSKSLTIFDLHSTLENKIASFFNSFEDENRDSSTVFLIKEYVSQNYQNENLSIKDISEHVFLSSSYVCTVFKAETNKTLNQFLTEYRIDKSKKLLMDSRYKITDISAKVGYNDGNYFGKTFKKIVGLSPSEFREQYLDGKI